MLFSHNIVRIKRVLVKNARESVSLLQILTIPLLISIFPKLFVVIVSLVHDHPRGERPPPRRQRYDAGDASSIQKLYRRDRKKAANQIFDNMRPFCDISKNDVQTHFTQIFSNRHTAHSRKQTKPRRDYARGGCIFLTGPALRLSIWRRRKVAQD